MKILAADGMRDDYFGLCLAVYQRQTLIAAPYRNSSAGAVYQYDIPYFPTFSPTISIMPTPSPTLRPTNPTFSPTLLPTKGPTANPTFLPSAPTFTPSCKPSTPPSLSPTVHTSTPTEKFVVSNKSDNSNPDPVHSVVFIAFISIVGLSCLLGLICCFCNQKSRVNNDDDGAVQMTSVVSVAPASPQFGLRPRFGSDSGFSRAVASAVLVPYASSPTHAQPPPLVFTNVVTHQDEASSVTQTENQLPVATVIP